MRLRVRWLFASCLSLLVLVACSPPVTSSSIVAAEQPVGACLDSREPDDTVVVVPCYKLHRWELFARIPYPAGAGDSYPGDAWLELYTSDICLPHFRAYTGADPARSDLSIHPHYPDENGWAAGQRDIVCTLSSPFTGSSPGYRRIVGSRASASGPITPLAPGSSNVTGGAHETALLGNWTTTDSASGARFLLRFRSDGMTSSAYYGGPHGPGGTYGWLGEDAIRLTFGSWGPAGEGDACASAPSFLRDFCQSRTIDYAGYPGPEETAIPPLTAPQNGAGPPYPTPTLAPVVVSEIEATFTVALEGDSLVLTHDTGISQRFRRLDN